MKLFISHSWRDKTAAQKLADALRSTTDVWLDLQQLYPGQHIQQTIDQAISQMDMMIVLWSATAARSDNVAAEIASASRQGITIVPCRLDETRLELDPHLAGSLAIDFKDERIGIGRVRMAVLRALSGSLGVEDVQALSDLKEFEGSLNYVNDYRNEQDISGEDSAYWGLKSVENTNRAFKSATAWRDNIGDSLEFMKSTMSTIQEAGNDRVRLAAIRDELTRHPQKDGTVVRELITFVEGKLESLQIDTAPPPSTGNSFERTITQVAQKIRSASREPLGAVRARLSAAYPTAVAAQAADALAYYIESCPGTLTEFAVLATSARSVSLQAVATRLFEYLVEPNELVPDGSNGILGFLDDAWLINNTIYRLIEAQIVDPRGFSVDWSTIITGDQVALHLFPPDIKTSLDTLLRQSIDLIVQEAQQYQPTWHSGGAFMGYGPAVGGTSEARTIDDLFYTVGDKAYFVF